MTIPGVAAPETGFSDIVAPVALSLEQERRVSDQIGELMGVAREENDYLSEQFTQWFLKEQVEEVSTMSSLLAVVAALRGFADADRGIPRARALAVRGLRSDRPDSGRRRALTRAPAQYVLVAAADRHLLGVEVLEQRLRELARGGELVAQLCERDRAAVSLR